MADEDLPSPDSGTTVATFFIRDRNVLLARADLGSLYVDYYLHLADNGLKPESGHDLIFKQALACLVLHCASRPQNEIIGWTIHFQKPLINLFLTGDNETGGVAGQVFTEEVRDGGHNLFYADVVRNRGDNRRSVVEFDGPDPFHALEHFYRQSEQRPARWFCLDEEEFVFLTAQPDANLAWLDSLTLEDVRQIAARESIRPLETRRYWWHCGCSQERICNALSSRMKADPEDLFQGEQAITVHCPRCGSRHRITRETLEAFVENSH